MPLGRVYPSIIRGRPTIVAFRFGLVGCDPAWAPGTSAPPTRSPASSSSWLWNYAAEPYVSTQWRARDTLDSLPRTCLLEEGLGNLERRWPLGPIEATDRWIQGDDIRKRSFRRLPSPALGSGRAGGYSPQMSSHIVLARRDHDQSQCISTQGHPTQNFDPSRPY